MYEWHAFYVWNVWYFWYRMYCLGWYLGYAWLCMVIPEIWGLHPLGMADYEMAQILKLADHGDGDGGPRSVQEPLIFV